MIIGYYRSKEVWIDGEFITPFLNREVDNHSSKNDLQLIHLHDCPEPEPVFSWGDNSKSNAAGRTQLALAILKFFFKKLYREHHELTLKLSNKFSDEIISQLPAEDSQFENHLVANWIINTFREIENYNEIIKEGEKS